MGPIRLLQGATELERRRAARVCVRQRIPVVPSDASVGARQTDDSPPPFGYQPPRTLHHLLQNTKRRHAERAHEFICVEFTNDFERKVEGMGLHLALLNVRCTTFQGLSRQKEADAAYRVHVG